MDYKRERKKLEELVKESLIVQGVVYGQPFKDEIEHLEQGFIELEKRMSKCFISQEDKDYIVEYCDSFCKMIRLMRQLPVADSLVSYIDKGRYPSWKWSIYGFVEDKKKSNENRKWGIAATSILALGLPISVGLAVFGVMFPIAVPVGILGGRALTQATITGEKHNLKATRKYIMEFFEKAKNKSPEIDQYIRSLYLINYYKSAAVWERAINQDVYQTKLFKETFPPCAEGIKREVILEIFQGKESCKRLNKWLSENYHSIIDDVCRERLYGEKKC